MIIRLFFVLLSCILYLPLSHAHDFDTNIMEYVLSNPNGNWTDFADFVENNANIISKDIINNTRLKIELVLELPGKKYVVLYVNENPNFTYKEIEKLIETDPMLSEIGAEQIYNFLSNKYASKRNSVFDMDFFLKMVSVGFMHIIGGLDHILFLITLIVCLPRTSRILWIITTFTIAHGITLILGGLGIITFSSIVVESMIRISIIILGIYALFIEVGSKKNIYLETTLIFILGLFHGLGFAGFFSGILQTSNNIIIPIIGFNLGIELGQFILMIFIGGILFFVYKLFSQYKNATKNYIAIFCSIVGLYWLISAFL